MGGGWEGHALQLFGGRGPAGEAGEGESLSLPSPALGLRGDPFPGKNGVTQLSLTLLGVGVMAGGGMTEGTLLSIQMLPQ